MSSYDTCSMCELSRDTQAMSWKTSQVLLQS